VPSDVASVAGLTTQPRCRCLECLRKLGLLGGTRMVDRVRITCKFTMMRLEG
jgi:hypothetical protein